MADKSLVIYEKTIRRGEPTATCACLGEDIAGEDGMFDRYQLAGTYVRIQPGGTVPPGLIPSDYQVETGRDPLGARAFIDAWIAAYGAKEMVGAS